VGANALAAASYPTANRATGVSWANAVGRTGSILGSMMGGFLLSLGWELPFVFSVAALPAFLAGGGILTLAWLNASARASAPQPAIG
jgi:MFS transporter, AAHS family, 4-hydroxybenzoate transporter